MRSSTPKELPPPPHGRAGWPWTVEDRQLSHTMSDGSCWPKISIVTPSFNQGQFIEETILSVLNQRYPNLEYILIDGGSTDSSVETIKKYEDQISYWVSEPDNGQSNAINKGWYQAKGDILAWLNADDLYLPGALRHAANFFSNNSSIMVLSGAGLTLFENTSRPRQLRPPSTLDPHLLLASCGAVPLQPSIFIRREVFDRIGPLNENLHFVMDWEYWIRIGLATPTHQIMTTDTPLSVNREWEGTKTNTGWRLICHEHEQVFKNIFASYPQDKELDQVKAAAYRSCHRKAADLARINRQPLAALKQVCKAWMIGPLSHNPMREMAILLYILIGISNAKKLKENTTSFRNWIVRRMQY